MLHYAHYVRACCVLCKGVLRCLQGIVRMLAIAKQGLCKRLQACKSACQRRCRLDPEQDFSAGNLRRILIQAGEFGIGLWPRALTANPAAADQLALVVVIVFIHTLMRNRLWILLWIELAVGGASW